MYNNSVGSEVMIVEDKHNNNIQVSFIVNLYDTDSNDIVAML